MLKLLLAVNFSASLIFLLLVSIISLFGSPLIFEDQNELYGPMAGNLRLMLVYLCLTELAVFSFCRFSDNYRGVLVLGLFLLLLAISIEFYGEINQVPIDENYRWFFMYLGLSHVAYGTLLTVNKVRHTV
jgi:hypothetical protein